MGFSIAGHELAFESRGEAGPYIVVLHGLTSDRATMIQSCDASLAQFRRVYIDLPGHGESIASLEHAGADAILDAICAVIDSVCGDAPVFAVGAAYGGYLALSLAARRAIRGLFLVAPVTEPELSRRSLPAQRALTTEALTFTSDAERDAFLAMAVRQTPAVLHAFRAAAYPATERVDRDYLDRVRDRYVFSRPFADALHGLTDPSAIVCGRDDHWTGFLDASKWVSLIPACDFSVIADAGPLLMLEQPECFRARLDEWCDKISRRS